jgi:hypothetical protein
MPQILILFFVFVFVLLFVLAAAQPLRRIMRIHRTPTTPLGMLPSYGSVEAVGQALAATGLSPISAQPCALWQIQVQEWRHSRTGWGWSTIFTQTSSAPFAIGDGTGQAMVESINGELVFSEDVKIQSGLFTSLSPEILAALERSGIATTGFLGLQRNLRVLERMISAGETIYVLGAVDSGAGRPIIRAAPDTSLIITDRSESDLLLHLYLQVIVWGVLALMLLGFIVVILL